MAPDALKGHFAASPRRHLTASPLPLPEAPPSAPPPPPTPASSTLWAVLVDPYWRTLHPNPAQVEELKNDLQDLRVQKRDLVKDLGRKEEQYDRARQQLEEARAQMKEEASERQQLEEEMRVMKNEVRDYRDRLENTNDSVRPPPSPHPPDPPVDRPAPVPARTRGRCRRLVLMRRPFRSRAAAVRRRC